MATFLKSTEIPTHGAHTLPREYFTSPDLLGEEMEKIFLQRWLCVGREDRIPNPGDWFTQAVGSESVIVLRDRAGTLRAYFNVCRHRGTRICEEHSGRFSETIQCPYHAWTWTLDGRLIGAPSTGDLEGFDK
ncbi:MAG TPA: Rieske (2Fe-2S) protein, partial [Gemmatimonadales bacterium]